MYRSLISMYQANFIFLNIHLNMVLNFKSLYNAYIYFNNILTAYFCVYIITKKAIDSLNLKTYPSYTSRWSVLFMFVMHKCITCTTVCTQVAGAGNLTFMLIVYYSHSSLFMYNLVTYVCILVYYYIRYCTDRMMSDGYCIFKISTHFHQPL